MYIYYIYTYTRFITSRVMFGFLPNIQTLEGLEETEI